jgi:hypothetical protein
VDLVIHVERVRYEQVPSTMSQNPREMPRCCARQPLSGDSDELLLAALGTMFTKPVEESGRHGVQTDESDGACNWHGINEMFAQNFDRKICNEGTVWRTRAQAYIAR